MVIRNKYNSLDRSGRINYGYSRKEIKMDKLNILWTNADPGTFDKMVAMYARNSLVKGWWDAVTLIIWGSPTKLTAESELVQLKIRELIQVAVKVTACKACADQYGVTEKLQELGVEVIYWGVGLTEILKGKEPLLTI